jgi:hypothetical protein
MLSRSHLGLHLPWFSLNLWPTPFPDKPEHTVIQGQLSCITNEGPNNLAWRLIKNLHLFKKPRVYEQSLVQEGIHNLLPSHKKIVFILRENYYICTISVKLTRIERWPDNYGYFRSDNLRVTNQQPWKRGNPTQKKRENKTKQKTEEQFKWQ